MTNFLLDSGADFLSVVATREEVESGNVLEVLKTLNSLMSSKQVVFRFFDRVDFGIYGYDDDARELFEIPEVRSFVRQLDEQFPYWFFFLSTKSEAIKLLVFSLCRITRLSPTATAYNKEDFEKFLNHHFAAMNYVFERFQIDEQMNIERSAELERYFLKSQIPK